MTDSPRGVGTPSEPGGRVVVRVPSVDQMDPETFAKHCALRHPWLGTPSLLNHLDDHRSGYPRSHMHVHARAETV